MIKKVNLHIIFLQIILLPIILFCSTTTVFAQTDYSSLFLPANLKKNANAVKRYQNTILEIKSNSYATLKTTYAISILNNLGANYASLEERYDKLYKIKNVDGYLYDAFGKKIKTLKNRDINDISGNSSNFQDDERIKVHNFNYATYPYTVEYSIESELNGIFYLPTFMPLNYYNVALQQASFTVIYPKNYGLRYKPLNLTAQPTIITLKDNLQLTWTLANIEALNKEWNAEAFQNIAPAVHIAPTDFEIQSYKGNMATWKAFGNFIYELNKNRDILPDNIKQTVLNLTQNLPTIKDKTFALYNYLQQNTRYISKQLGIGGWQTYDATSVALKGFGDCKALSNYMVSLLKMANIKAHYTLINAGEKPQFFMADFPSNQFNHIIVCVPNNADTIWLECTSQNIAPAYLGSFTANRYALLIDNTGGTLTRTPIYTPKQNSQIRKIEAVLNTDGLLNATVTTIYSGEQQDDLQQAIKSSTPTELLTNINQKLNIPSYEITNLSYKEFKTAIPAITEQLNITINNFASITGKRLYFTPNIYNKTNLKLLTNEPRIGNLNNIFGYTDVDSVIITIPSNYTLETTLLPKTFTNLFGSYTTTITHIGNKLIYVRSITINAGIFSKAVYVTIANWYQDIYKADRQMVTFIKQE